MGLAELLGAMDADAQAEIDRITAGKDARCAAIREEVEARIREEAAKRASLTEARRSRLRQRRAAEIDAEATRLLARARADVAEMALAALRERLSALRSDPARHDRTTAALVREGLAALPGASEVRVDTRDADRITRLLAARGAKARVVPGLTTWAGAVLTDGAGRTLDNTLEARLEQATEELLVAVARGLPALREEAP